VTGQATNKLSEVIAFHGHFCPGLTIGYRMALIGLRELGVERARDEELVAICENDACGIDAVQYLTGCTLGKGNLILRDNGKQVITFGRRSDNRMIRVSLRHGALDDVEAASPEERRRIMIERLQEAPEDRLFEVRWVETALPAKARIFKSVQCAGCGEGVMEARVRLREGQPLCPDCYGEPYGRGW
jgi:formylmethanofuran dehydrogenase subunit E